MDTDILQLIGRQIDFLIKRADRDLAQHDWVRGHRRESYSPARQAAIGVLDGQLERRLPAPSRQDSSAFGGS